MNCSHVQFRIHEKEALQSENTPIDLRQLKELFNVVAFWARDRRIEEFAIAIRNSYPVVSVWEGDRLIGFARATSDGVYRAALWDVVLHPDYQGAGLGRKLVETILAHPHLNSVERVYLMTSSQQKFYERIGFEENKTTTMVFFSKLASEAESLPEIVEVH